MIAFAFSGATTDNLPAGVLYKVKASYKYQAEDTDELSFEVGEIMQVVEYDDPEEQASLKLCHDPSVEMVPGWPWTLFL